VHRECDAGQLRCKPLYGAILGTYACFCSIIRYKNVVSQDTNASFSRILRIHHQCSMLSHREWQAHPVCNIGGGLHVTSSALLKKGSGGEPVEKVVIDLLDDRV
jgi:hypothetical protein